MACYNGEPTLDSLLTELYDTTKLYERIRLPGGQTEGNVMSSRTTNREKHSLRRVIPKPGTDQAYAEEYRRIEEAAFQAAASEERPSFGDMESVNEMEALSTLGTAAPNMDEFLATERTEVYDRYDFHHEPAVHLPIASYRKTIVDMVQAHPVVVIEGHTGCGKTTQVPQYILDHHRENRRPCNIIVTQPRRIAAISVSKRVALERGWPLGTIVGYKIGLKSEMCEDTRLLYCTTGVLLQTIVSEKNMNQYTHIIIDEAHERDQDMDFLLLLARKMQRSNSSQVKVVIMSATFNCHKFAEYFSTCMFGTIREAPILTIDKRMAYTVSEYYIEDFRRLVIKEWKTNSETPVVTKDHHILAKKLIEAFDEIEFPEQEERMKNRLHHSELQRGSVLVFLPGIYEIENLYSQLNKDKIQRKWNIMPLHSSITSEEQAAVFNAPQQGFRKIILSTNIAESSITVPDIIYVIDYCMTKQLVKDEVSNFTTLELTWASKSNCTQRSGRVGRVATGRVYRLLSREHFRMLDEEQQPEILRCPLSRLVLMAKVLDTCPPKELLALAIDPPDLDNIQRTVLFLKEAGGLLKNVNGVYSTEDGDITYIGRVMARLPVDIYVAKLIVLGQLFCVLDSCIIIAAAMSVKNMFATRFREQMNTYVAKLSWSDSSNSDQIAFLNVYKVWQTRKRQGYFERTIYSSEKQWADTYGINLRSLYEINDLISELYSRLRQFGIEEDKKKNCNTDPNKVAWSGTEQPLVLKLVLAGALYPNYFVRGSLGGQVSEKDAVRTLVGRDPYSTVYLTNFNEKQPGEFYVDSIKTLLQPCAPNMKVSFENSSKIFIEFPKDDESDTLMTDELPYKLRMPGRVSLTVYKAVKMRQLGMSLPLHVLPEFKAVKYSSQKQRPCLLSYSDEGRKELNHEMYKQELRNRWTNRDSPSTVPLAVPKPPVTSRFPPLDVSHLHLNISHVVDAGKFWVQDASESTIQELARIQFMLNKDEPGDLIPLASAPSIGQLVVAPFEGRYMFRAKVVYVKEFRQGVSAIVRYIDYGNTENFYDVSRLRDYGRALLNEGVDTIPPIAIECVLAEIEPSVLTCCNGQWSEEANNFFSGLVKNKNMYAKVYSVCNSVMSLVLFEDSRSLNTINDILVNQKFAQPSEESFLSKANHEARANVNDLSLEMKIIFESQQQYLLDVSTKQDVLPVELEKEATQLIHLKGPFSPLEMKVYPILRSSGVNKEVTIEQLSVNSVLLDDNPQDRNERMVVAGCVQTTSKRTLILRQTTILPNIPGLPALVALIFSPSCELRVNESYSRLTGVICGLGCEPYSGNSYFSENDVEITFDAKFDMADIETVNHLRLWMNNALHTNVGEIHPHHTLAQVQEYQLKIKHFLSVLLMKKRDWQDPEPPSDDHTWNSLEPESLLHPGEFKFNGRQIFQVIWGVALETEGARKKRELGKNVKELLELADSGIPIHHAKCLMCKATMHSITELRLHIFSNSHLERETLLNIDLNNEKSGHEPMFHFDM